MVPRKMGCMLILKVIFFWMNGGSVCWLVFHGLFHELVGFVKCLKVWTFVGIFLCFDLQNMMHAIWHVKAWEVTQALTRGHLRWTFGDWIQKCWWGPFWHIKFLPSLFTTIRNMNDYLMYQTMLNWYTCVHKFWFWS